MKTAACTHHVTYFCMKTKTSWSLCPSNFVEQLCWLYLSRDMAAWWRYRMETFSELLALCAGKSPHKGRWRGALMFFSALCLNKRLSKQSWGWWIETPSHPSWRHSNSYRYVQYIPWNIRISGFSAVFLLWSHYAFLAESCDIFAHILQGCFIGTEAIAGLPNKVHYHDVIMRAMAPQITILTIVYSAVYSGTDQRNHQSSASLAFVVTGEFPTQRASDAENVSIWWRHHKP